MNSPANGILLFFMLTNLAQLGSSRLKVCIHMLSLQGMALAVLPFMVSGEGMGLHAILAALFALTVRGIAIPWLLLRALRETGVNREVEPYIGFSASILTGVCALAACFYFSPRLALPSAQAASDVVPVALFSIFAGLFLIITRRKALTQVAGYLVIENGIYAFGVAVAADSSWLIELGVMLDILVAILIMAIMVYHINREFDHINIDCLSSLHDRRTPVDKRTAPVEAAS
ncbi:MAG: hydrogenase [Spartobacteria bacterium]|nr:hydrogenase [Spartobacteria bacterium]